MPDDGESLNLLRHRTPTAAQTASGFVVPEGLKPDAPLPHDEPQSLKTWTEPVSFKNPAARKIPGTFVAFLHDGDSVEKRRQTVDWQHAEARGWVLLTLDSDHNAQWSHPKELAQLLEEVAGRRP